MKIGTPLVLLSLIVSVFLFIMFMHLNKGLNLMNEQVIVLDTKLKMYETCVKIEDPSDRSNCLNSLTDLEVIGLPQ